MLRLLIGGSPCTYWSIAQTKGRETEPSGMGWELFLNYLIALEKYKPDYFLYENNKSMSAAIRAEITKRFGFEPVCINSALVSAQSRQRLCWVGRRDPITGRYHPVPVSQPADRGIILQDILETGEALSTSLRCDRKARTVMAAYKNRGTSASCLLRDAIPNLDRPEKQLFDFVAEPIYVGEVPGHKGEYRNGKQASQQYRVYSVAGKSVCLDGDSRKHIAVPVMRVPEATKQGYVDIYPGECVDLAQEHSKTRRGRRMAQKSNCLTTTCAMYEYCGTLDKPIYQVKDGYITINGQQYEIKLRDGCYIIRKLTVTECKRIQTVPETYIFPVSDTQAYKMLGNGWTVDVIAHIMSYFEGITTQPVEVLSMYDGMSCGHIALDKLGANVARYYATEIDKYAIQTTQYNYPETIQLWDAFQVRWEGWPLREELP